MISSVLAYLWLSMAPASRVLLIEPNPASLSLGRTVTHLRDFFDARSLAPGEAIFPLLLSLAPKTQLQPAQPSADPATSGNVIEPFKAVGEPIAAKSTPAPNSKSSNQSYGGASHRHASPQAIAALSLGTTPKAGPSPSPTRPDAAIVEDKPVDLDLVASPLNTVLDVIMAQTKVNMLLIADPKLTITLRARQRRFIDVLSDICAITDLSYLKVGNEYVIATDEKLKTAYHDAYKAAHPDKPTVLAPQPEIVTETYHTNYCDGNKLIAALKDEFKNSDLTMIAAPASSTPQLSDQDESSKSGVSSSTLGVDEESGKTSRLIVLRGSPGAVEMALSLMRKLDASPAQVNIAVTINDLSLDAEKNLGIDWAGSSSVAVNENQPSGIGFANFVRSPLSFQATLNYLQSKGEDKLLASPNITVLDGQRAYILVGQRLEFPIISSIQQNGQPLYNVDEERVGIYLQVSVWVTNDGKVKLQLYPQVSTVTSFINVNGGQYPQISTREAQTTLSVESGHTILIGGLIHDEDIINMEKVPILSQIPILGELFMNRDHQRTRDEVVISITPTISANP